MSKLSRRALARYGVEQLQNGVSSSQVAKRLVAGMVDSGKTNEYELLLEDIMWELENRGQLAVSKVTTAYPLSNRLKLELQGKLKDAVNVKNVVLEEQIDKKILGGVRIETASRVWDYSLSKKLAKLREVF